MVRIMSCSRILLRASTSATNAPVIDAVRVPPSAWMTSQSSVMVRSPSCSIFVTARSDRPISRWISCVRPPTRPDDASRCVRVVVARGSMPYSAVTHPLPELRRKRRHAVLDAGRADHFRLARFHEDRSFRVDQIVRRDARGSKLFVEASVRSHGVVTVMYHCVLRTSDVSRSNGRRKSTWPASVSACLPPMRICTRSTDERLAVTALTIA